MMNVTEVLQIYGFVIVVKRGGYYGTIRSIRSEEHEQGLKKEEERD